MHNRHDATVDVWIVEAPWAHTDWHSYVLMLARLRDAPPGRARIVQGATHEINIFPMNPTADREKVILGQARIAPMVLQPPTFVSQFRESNDITAGQRMRAAVAEVLAGKLNPNIESRKAWMALFGADMLKDSCEGN